jgi:polyhydroxyalkanoate synthesis regulator protein
MGGLSGYSSNNASKPEAADPKNETKDDLAAIKTQLSELQEKLNKLS